MNFVECVEVMVCVSDYDFFRDVKEEFLRLYGFDSKKRNFEWKL